MAIARSWDGSSYDRLSSPMEALGREVVARLELRGDETVLDAGCGSGRVTEPLLERLPHGRVIGVDGSPSMIERARQRLGERAELHVADLLDLELEEPVDAVFSSATFHWIADHDRLFERLFAALEPGGRLLAQCGGEGNIATVVAALHLATREPPFAPHFEGWPGPWNYAGPKDTVARLQRAGFVDASAGLHDEPVVPDDPREYFATIMLGSHLERLPGDLRGRFVDRVLAELGDPVTVDYVRLTMSARTPPES